MLYPAKFAGLGILVWFYLTAKGKNQPPIQWAVIGFIGYWLTWWLVKLSVLHPIGDILVKSPVTLFLVMQIPAIAGVFACILIRKKLLSNASKNESPSL